MRKLIVNKKYNNKKLSKFILDNFNNLSNNTLYKALRKKDIKVNGIRINENINVFENDVIEIYISDKILFATEMPKIIYEDDNILIVHKPINIEVIGDHSLTSIINDYYPNYNIKPCHRLDRNTSGLILFAKNDVSLDILLNKFKKNEIEKHYLAKVYGVPKKSRDILNAYLFKDSKKSMVYISDTPRSGYRNICTEYSVVKSNTKLNYSILDVKLHTGRTHQIRAHLAHIGYPIIGDGKYGVNKINNEFKVYTQQLVSYKLKFNFSSDSGILNYLNGNEFKEEIEL